MYLPEEFDYINLMNLGRDDGQEADAARVAVLGFCTTQYYTGVLRGLGKTTGFPIVTYEPEYNTVHQTVLDEASELYSFRPDFVVFLTAVQALRNVLLSADSHRRSQLADGEVQQLVSLIKRVAQIAGVTVLVNEFVVPYERAWGNFTARVPGSLATVVRSINDRLRHLADELPNVYTIDSDHIASWLGKRTWFDERLWFYSKSFCHPEALPHVASQAIDIFRAVRGKGFKCVALDLDNVLWGGTIGDDGLEGIRLGELGEGEAFVQFQLWLKELRSRGIILGVCSKNDDDKAREPFQKHRDMVLAESDMSCFIANWDNKADNLRVLAKRLNIGLDSIVFLDDSPFERNLVRELVPEVCVPELPTDPADYVPYLESLNLFEAAQFSDEDRKRADFYRANALREDEEARFTSVAEYLVSLQMEAAFERFDDLHMPRIAQLVQRTNQFNLTTIRHSAEELTRFADDPDYFPFYTTLTDRFGESGLISVVIGKREGDCLDIVTWLMSCRVISRRLEEFVLDRLVEAARDVGLTRLRGRYTPTQKNGLVSKHYEKLGFRLIQELPDGSTVWELAVGGYVPSGAPIERRILQFEA
jgi:FkbH-like protein